MLIARPGTDYCQEDAKPNRRPRCGDGNWHLHTDRQGNRDQCVKTMKNRGTVVKDPKCAGDGFTYMTVAGSDWCRAQKGPKTAPYTCAVGSPRTDVLGVSDRCIQDRDVSYIEPMLELGY